MASLDEIKIDLKGIGDVISSNSLFVPKYQRSYAWKDQNIIDLFQDISTAISDGSKEYFLGSIVVSFKIEKKPEVIDGQQRLATSIILLAAIRDYFYTCGDTTRSKEIEKDFLKKTDLESLESIPKLFLNEADNDYFCKRILSSPDHSDRKILPLKESHKRIDKAAQIASSHINKLTTITKEPVKSLISLVYFIKDSAKIIFVRVPDDANAFTIFETLNDRGLPLAISDLLKNYLFYMSDNRLDEVQQAWISMTGALEAIDSEDIVVTYIRHLWSSKNGPTRERDLYKSIKSKITSKQSAVDFAKELQENSRIYSAIINHSHELWSEYGATSRGCIATLNLLGMVQIRPLLLAILSKLDLSERKKCLRILVSVSTRFLIYGGLSSGGIENQYCSRAVDIRSDKISSAKQLLDAIKEIVPSDTVFQKAFENVTISKEALARYYLRVLERQNQGDTEPELVPNASEEEITLEHILPEHPSAAWDSIFEETHKAYFKRLGNLCLLKHKINSDIGNKGFLAKREFYSQSAFQLTKELSKINTWTTDDIDSRQKRLAELAIQSWPLNV
jgi:uncharacterized protein with ParB-like and HNH nuclease domain